MAPRVVCLVRGTRGLALPAAGGDVRVVVGDICAEGLGLSARGRRDARRAGLIVHAAADVRLVAAPAELARTNTDAVRRLLRWVDTGAPGVTLHHVSTLAVAGRVTGPARRFAEADLSFGQQFVTPYEHSKFDAELSVREWAATGRAAFVYRAGHVAADSSTGAFQVNVGANRIYQLLRGYILAGRAPSRPADVFAFSHVDTVAAGLAAIALHPHTAPGAHHLETPHEVPHDELIGWLGRCGYPVRLTDDDGFRHAVRRLARSHPLEAAQLESWTDLPDRGVVVDRDQSTALLSRLGIRFAAPTPQWLAATLDWSAKAGFLPPPDPHRPDDPSGHRTPLHGPVGTPAPPNGRFAAVEGVPG